MIKKYKPIITCGWNQYYDGRDGILIGSDKHLNVFVWDRLKDEVKATTKNGNTATASTIEDALFEPYQQGTDFIQRFIFPGGCLPSVPALVGAAKAAGFAEIERFGFGSSYALTLKQ